jgi:Haloacid dehalogenase-like hydrolase
MLCWRCNSNLNCSLKIRSLVVKALMLSILTFGSSSRYFARAASSFSKSGLTRYFNLLIYLIYSRSVPSFQRNITNTHTVRPKLDYAFAFDIDGVLLLGSNPIPAGVRALKRLEEKKIPYILLTNGGGKWEPDRVAELCRLLGANVFSPWSINIRFPSISLFKVILPTNISLISIQMSSSSPRMM